MKDMWRDSTCVKQKQIRNQNWMPKGKESSIKMHSAYLYTILFVSTKPPYSN